MNRVDELLDYLRRKGCAMSRSRTLEDLRWPGPEFDAAISVLMREHKIRAPRPGEYEITPAPVAGHEPVPQRPVETRAM